MKSIIEQLQGITTGLNEILESAKELTEDQVNSLIEGSEFAALAQSINELSKSIDDATADSGTHFGVE